MNALAALQHEFMRYLHEAPNAFVDTLAANDGLAPAARAHMGSSQKTENKAR